MSWLDKKKVRKGEYLPWLQRKQTSAEIEDTSIVASRLEMLENALPPLPADNHREFQPSFRLPEYPEENVSDAEEVSAFSYNPGVERKEFSFQQNSSPEFHYQLVDEPAPVSHSVTYTLPTENPPQISEAEKSYHPFSELSENYFEELFAPERLEVESGVQEETVSVKSTEIVESLPVATESLPVPQPAKKTPQKSAPVSEGESATSVPRVDFNWQLEIPYSLLKKQENPYSFEDQQETEKVISRLEETLDQFGIEGRVIGIQRGPIITRYEAKIPPGIKVSRILGLTDEIAMALEAIRVRIEAPIPGRSSVGIEVPNKKRAKVLLGDIVHDPAYQESNAFLPLPMGRDIAGNIVIEDLARMPHLLIAGATGSGKSVAVNSFITSLIMHRTPAEVRFLLVDPKLVELSHYNDIPHLLHPVITDHQKAILALNWAVEEMERRYEDLAETRVRDIRSYNEKIAERNQGSPMPYIVILIDELGDLMMVAGKEVESSIIRLSQKARAVGIHLILATQRPSVDVITALIKANCPARIALQVAQKTDSRTILDSNGAEDLLGQGDMLFKHPSRGQLIRVQAPLVVDTEVENVVLRVKKSGKPAYIYLEDPKTKESSLESEDEDLMEEAWQIIVESQKASASYLQRRLRIGYNRAARLIEAFEARGMIGPQIGSKPREIFTHD